MRAAGRGCKDTVLFTSCLNRVFHLNLRVISLDLELKNSQQLSLAIFLKPHQNNCYNGKVLYGNLYRK